MYARKKRVPTIFRWSNRSSFEARRAHPVFGVASSRSSKSYRQLTRRHHRESFAPSRARLRLLPAVPCSILLDSGLVQDFRQPPCKQFEVARFALPDNKDSPSGMPQGKSNFLVPLNVLSKLPAPEIHSALRFVRKSAAMVSMPETSMDENHRPKFRQYNIGSARKV
jgi:hypothetical protein